jgi:hypothetical protein
VSRSVIKEILTGLTSTHTRDAEGFECPCAAVKGVDMVNSPRVGRVQRPKTIDHASRPDVLLQRRGTLG